MTLETAAITALGTVTSGLVFLAKLMYNRLIISEVKIDKLETKIAELQLEINELSEENGHARAQVDMYRNCPKKLDCPFYREYEPSRPH